MLRLLTIGFTLWLLGCQQQELANKHTQHATHPASSPQRTPNTPVSTHNFRFKEAFAGKFLVGTALNREQILDDKKIQGFVSEQFNALTAENAMKWERIHPLPEEYEWRAADALVAYSRQHDIFVTGHTLVWHQQVPDWVFAGNGDTPLTAELLRQRMGAHIAAVVGRYKGQIQSWDVLNEAFNEDGSYRESPWYNLLGADYIAQAFQLAHRADPAAKLYYNDYNLWKPEKRAAVIRMVKRLQQQGIAIHGVGMQGHYGLDHPKNLQHIADAIADFHALGVDVMVTELDVSVLPFPETGAQGADISLNFAMQKKYNPYTEGLPQDVQQAFDERYMALFEIFLRHSEKLHRITFWGVDDAQSWRNHWPIEGRTDYPLLVDRRGQIKPIATSLVQARQQ